MTRNQFVELGKIVRRKFPNWELFSGEIMTMSPEREKRLVSVYNRKEGKTQAIYVDFSTMSVSEK